MKAKPYTYTDTNGITVTVYPMAKPRASEKTFRNNKYSIFNIGATAARLGRYGFFATTGA